MEEGTQASSSASDLITVLEAMDADMLETIKNNDGQHAEDEQKEEKEAEGEEEINHDNKTKERKLPTWMRDPKEVAEEQVQHALALQAKKVIFI